MLGIYKASAGSGKTYRLTQRYITLLLTDTDNQGRTTLVAPGTRGRHRHILAITFTNKATDEMKRRIVHELGVLAGMERGWTAKSAYLPDLMKLTGATEEQIADRAATALRDLLHDFGYFSVSTIDSFFQSVLRTFAREAELPGNYEVDLDQEASVKLGINEMLRSVNRAEGGDAGERSEALRLEQWLSALMTDMLRRGKGFNLFNRNTDVHRTVVNFMRGLADETYAAHSEEIDEYLSDPSRLTALTGAVRRRIDSLVEQTRAACSAAATLPGLTKFASENFASRAIHGYVKPKSGGLPKTFATIAENPAKAFLAKANPDAAALTLAAAAATAVIECTQAELLTDIIHQLYVLGLMGRINRYIAEFRAESATLLLSDTNSILRRIIGPDSTPFIYERTGQWIHHFLIDEFQDTSKLQWLNLTPLIEESLSEGNDNLVIGDEKQCIYRFRNSDPSLLRNLKADFGAQAAIEGDNIEGNTNWRSAAEIVRFNNTFFRALADMAGPDTTIGAIYAGATQKVSEKKTSLPGHVTLEPYATEPGARADEMREAAFAHTIENIRAQIARGYAPADIAVLFRKGKDSAAFIERLIARVESDPDYPRLKVMSDESLYVSRSRAVRLVISVLRILAARNYAGNSRNLTDRQSAELLNRYERRLSAGESAEKALAAAVEENAGQIPVELHPDVTDLECATLVSVIDRIISCYVSPDQRRAENVYLTALADLALDMTARGVTDVQGFLQWWDDKGRNSAVPASADPAAIRVMTIHKSKGLEFSCVHIPFCDSPEPPEGVKWFEPADFDFVDDPSIIPPLIPLHPRESLLSTGYAAQYRRMVDDSEVDQANVIYVAFTRAMRELNVGYLPGATASKPFSHFIGRVIDHAAQPGFLDGAHRSFPAEAGEAYCAIEADADGRVEIGAPTHPVADSKPLTLLDPSGTVAVPVADGNFSAKLWDTVRLDDDDDPLLPSSGGIEVERRVMNMAMKGIADAADIDKTVLRLVTQGRVPCAERDSFAALLRDRTAGAATAQWFDADNRVALNRTIATGNGGATTADRLVWLPGGTLDVVQYLGDDAEAAEENVRLLVRSLSRAGQGRVRGFVWDLVTGRVTAVER